MAIFGTIPYDFGSESIAQAVDAIQARRQARGLLSEPFSLAELFMDRDDWHWLCQWARALPGHVVTQWIASYAPYQATVTATRKEAFGLLFLLFASEAARRDASGEQLWHHVVKDEQNAPRFPRTGHTLFVSGQPGGNLKAAMQSAAYHFGLRHHFGHSEDMQWLGTVLLQALDL